MRLEDTVPDIEQEMLKVIKALKNIRSHIVTDEYELQKKIDEVLTVAGIGHQKEYKLGPRNRVDFLTDIGIVIEVKKGKPSKAQVIKQLQRYASFETVKAVILAVETSLDIPNEVNGKPCISLGLQKQWGIAV